MLIQEWLDDELFLQMQGDGMVTVRQHNDLPLYIANYTDRAQYANLWNDITMNCRGLVYNKEGLVLARPWRKFFNLGDAKSPHIGFGDRCEVTDKMDGSLGILYYVHGKLHISTRGSFHSAQAEWATKHIQQYARLENWQCERYTFLFEIIYPKNRIVVDYGSYEGLILLGAVEITTGYALGPYEACALLNWPGLVTEVMPYRSINDVLAADDRENTEGYVIRAGNRMVKWKRPDYVELHRLISNLSEKSVWSGLEGGRTPEELCVALPDEFHGFVKDTSTKMLLDFAQRKGDVTEKYHKYMYRLGSVNDRRRFALTVQDDPDKRYMFALLDDKDIGPMVWQELKPKGE